MRTLGNYPITDESNSLGDGQIVKYIFSFLNHSTFIGKAEKEVIALYDKELIDQDYLESVHDYIDGMMINELGRAHV